MTKNAERRAPDEGAMTEHRKRRQRRRRAKKVIVCMQLLRLCLFGTRVYVVFCAPGRQKEIWTRSRVFCFLPNSIVCATFSPFLHARVTRLSSFSPLSGPFVIRGCIYQPKQPDSVHSNTHTCTHTLLCISPHLRFSALATFARLSA